MFFFFSILISFYIAVILIPLIRRLGARLNILDIPDCGKVHKIPTPRIGGIGIVAGAIIPILIWGPITNEFRAFLIGIAILFIFGLLDDLVDLNYKLKFLGQILAISATMALGQVFIVNLGVWRAGEIILPYWAAIPLTFFFILGITNAINFTDGLDGLAGGVSILIFLSIGILAYLDNRVSILICCMGIVGALLAFLRYNTYPASIFMGDTGSQFLGFSAAVLCVYLTQYQSTAIARTLPLIILGFPIMDTLYVISERVICGESPFKRDLKQFHYRLLKFGFTHKDAVIAIYFIHGLMVFLSIQLRYSPEPWVIFTDLSLAIPILLLLYLAHRTGWKFQKGVGVGNLWNKLAGKRFTVSLKNISLMYIKIILPLGLVWLAISSPLRVVEVNVVIFIMGLLALVAYKIDRTAFKILFRLTSYILVIYLLLNSQTATIVQLPFSQKFFHYIFWGSLAVCALIYLLITRFKFLKTTPLDYLILILVISIPFLPLEQVRTLHLGTVAGGMVVFAWVCEILLANRKKDVNLFSLSCLTAILILFSRYMIF